MTELCKATEQKPPIALMLLGKGGTGKSSIAAVLTENLLERGYNAKLIRFDKGIYIFSNSGSDSWKLLRPYRSAAAYFPGCN